MSEPLVKIELHGDVATLTLNRPEKRNAVNLALADEFIAALAELESTKVIVLTGAGDRAFCAGMDLSERSELGWAETLGVGRSQFWFEAIEAMRRHPAVFVAAVNGVAVGGGLTLVNTAELAIAADNAEFGMPEMGFGSFPALSGPSTIKRTLSKHAAELILVPKRIDARRALEWGLVNEVVPFGDLLDRAHQVASSIATIDDVVLGVGKRAIHELQRMDWTNAIDYGVLVSSMIRQHTQQRKVENRP